MSAAHILLVIAAVGWPVCMVLLVRLGFALRRPQPLPEAWLWLRAWEATLDLQQAANEHARSVLDDIETRRNPATHPSSDPPPSR